MTNAPPLLASFTFSSAALMAIEQIRTDWQNQFGNFPDVVCVAWGLYEWNDGHRGEGVIVSFYTRDQRRDLEPAIQNVSGVETILFTIPDYAHHFEGKVVDFSEQRFFFLRDP
jgi:hypothetical protein